MSPDIRIRWTLLLESGVYEPLPKDPTAKKPFPKHKTALLTDLKHKLTPYHSKPPHLYGLPKVRKPYTPLRPIVSSTGSPCNALAGKSESFVKNLGHFIESQSPDTLISFDISLFTNVPVNEALQVISNKLHNDDTLAERSALQAKAIMDLLEVYLRTTYFRVDDKLFQQRDGMAMGSSLSQSLATSTWSILRNWLVTRYNINHCCGSITLLTHL
jgi:hypothetical protein